MKTDIKQHDITDCAAASICSIARYYGSDIPITAIREASGTDQLGTSVKGIIDACPSLGFRAAGYKSADRDPEMLRGIGAPVILHTINRRGDLHFVVLYGIRRDKATVMDPSQGRHIKVRLSDLAKEWSGIVITLTPDPGRAIQNTTKPKSFFFSCISILAKSRSDILLSLPGFLLMILSGICISIVLQHIIDTVIPSGDIARLKQTCITAGLLMVFSASVSYGCGRRMIRAGVRMDSFLILDYLRHLFALPPGFFAKRGAGELNSRIPDAMKVRRLLTDGLSGILTSAMLLAGSLVLMFTYYWKLALLTAAFIPIYAMLFILVNNINRTMNRKLVESAADFERQSVESISSIRAIKYFGNGRTGIRDLERKYASMSWNMARNASNQNKFSTSSEAISKVLSLTIITIGSYYIFNGVLTTGQLVSFYSLSALFANPLSQMVSVSSYWNEASLSLERLGDITQLETEEDAGLEADLSQAMEIEFRNITFSYPGCSDLLKNFNLTIPAGSITAITGESGCGKSSLASLLMRDFKPREGKILLGSTDISLIGTAAWRRYISIVPQDAAITSGTLLDNISGGESSPDLKKISGILDSLGLKEFITSLPLGILSQAGEKGCLLSGGQKQRIALARALYRDPRILILDEATASLDEESQKYILAEAVELRNQGRTVIMITHRKDNMTIADKVCRM